MIVTPTSYLFPYLLYFEQQVLQVMQPWQLKFRYALQDGRSVAEPMREDFVHLVHVCLLARRDQDHTKAKFAAAVRLAEPATVRRRTISGG
ncbi:MAG: hypothetical protein CBE43_01455 [Rhodopirellula sp. TMED283]|nr:MAG: hypothetical protein CBE43_01455 [Rhodopirellula sp. TMED283]